MSFYMFTRTQKFDHEHQGYHSHKIHIIVDENEESARMVLAACCSAFKETPTNESTEDTSDLFKNPEYFFCKQLREDDVTKNYPELLGNPKEVRFPSVDAQYWLMRPSKFK